MYFLIELVLELIVEVASHKVFQWIPRRRRGPKATKRGFLLRHSTFLRGFALLLWFGWFLALTTLLLPPCDIKSWKTILVLVAMWFIVWPIGWLVTVAIPVFLVTDREIVELLCRGRRRRLRFDQITMVTSGYRIYGANGTTIVFPRGAVNYRDFAHVLLKRVPQMRLKCIESLESDVTSPSGF